MQDRKDGRMDCADMFNKFFKSAKLSSTYKPVLVAALVDVSDEGGGGVGRKARKKWTRREGGCIRVDLNAVAVPFAKFYWDMTASLYPRHMPPRMADPDDPGKDVAIVRLIEEEVEARRGKEARGPAGGAGKNPAGAPGESRRRGKRAPDGNAPPTLGELASDKMAGFRKKVIDESITPEVLEHLLTDMKGLYEICDGKDAIMLDGEAAAHMGRNAVTIRAALGHMITRHLEENNPSARHLATMANLNEKYRAKIRRVNKQEANAAPPRGDIVPLYTISQDDIVPLYTISRNLADGLGRLAGPRAQGRQ